MGLSNALDERRNAVKGRGKVGFEDKPRLSMKQTSVHRRLKEIFQSCREGGKGSGKGIACPAERKGACTVGKDNCPFSIAYPGCGVLGIEDMSRSERETPDHLVPPVAEAET